MLNHKGWNWVSMNTVVCCAVFNRELQLVPEISLVSLTFQYQENLLKHTKLFTTWHPLSIWNEKQKHAHTHTHISFYGLRGLSIGVMVFILYKLYRPTPKLQRSPQRRLPPPPPPPPLPKHSVWFICVLNYGDTKNILINQLLLVITIIPMSLYKFVSSNHINMHSLSLSLTHTHTPTTAFTQQGYSSPLHLSSLTRISAETQ